MDFFSIVGLALIYLRVVNSAIGFHKSESNNHTALRRFVDWNYTFAGHYETKQAEYEAAFNEIGTVLLLPEYGNIGSALTDMVTYASGLRTILVNGDGGIVSIDERLIINVVSILELLLITCDVFDGLKARIDEWTREEDGRVPFVSVKEPIPFEWFKAHGFTDSSLNDVTIEVLRNEVDKLYGDGKPICVLLEFFGSSFYLGNQYILGSQLSYLVSYGASPTAMAHLEGHLRNLGGGVPQGKIDELIAKLRHLGAADGPLLRLIGKSSSEGLYTYHIKLASYALFREVHTARYFKILTRICQVVEGHLASCERILRLNNQTPHINFWLTHGVYAESPAIAEYKLADQVRALISEDGPITELCRAVMEIVDSKDKQTEEPDNGVATNLRS